MPSSTPKQARVMAALAHGWHPDKGSLARIPVSVAKEFNAADQAKAHAGGRVRRALGERPTK
jgi:hypothetical protein